MAITEALVKRVNSFDLKKINATEEEYIVWQVADTFFNSTVGDVGTLSTSSSGNTSIGSHTDTSYDQAVGAHPGASLTQSTTTTNLYQNFGADATVNSVHPIINTNNTLDFKSADSSEIDTILDRLIEKVFGDSYFDYRLGSTAPAGYTLYISSVFSDTRADGTSVDYNLYKKNLPAKPTTIRPMKSVGSDFRTMTDTEIKECFAQRIRNKISDNSIGSYKLNSSTIGAPSNGTWIALGTAIDSIQDTADQNYTRVSNRDSTLISNRDSTQNFTRISAVAYAGNYIGAFTRARNAAVYAAGFSGAYTRASTTTFSGAYSRISATSPGSTVNFVGNYSGTYSRTSTRDSTRTRLLYYSGRLDASFVGNFIGNFVGNFVGNYTRTSQILYTVGYLGNYLGTNFTGNYAGNFAGNFTRTRLLYYSGRLDASYVGNYAGNFAGNFTRISNIAYSRSSSILYTGNYTGGYTGNFTGNYTGTYDGINYTATFIGNYSSDFVGNYTAEYTGDYTGNFIGDYTGNFIGNYTGNYAGETIQSSSSQVEIYTLYHRIA